MSISEALIQKTKCCSINLKENPFIFPIVGNFKQWACAQHATGSCQNTNIIRILDLHKSILQTCILTDLVCISDPTQPNWPLYKRYKSFTPRRESTEYNCLFFAFGENGHFHWFLAGEKICFISCCTFPTGDKTNFYAKINTIFGLFLWW